MNAGPEVVPVGTHASMRAEVTMPLTHLCPFKDEVDKGSVTLAWYVSGQTLELHSVRDWLAGFADKKVSHEELTGGLRGHLVSLGFSAVSVTTHWNTAGGIVVVRA